MERRSLADETVAVRRQPRCGPADAHRRAQPLRGASRVSGDRARDPRLAALEGAVRGAAAVALGYFGKVRAERKPDRSLVTEADRAVERFLVPKLQAIAPGARILGEEGTQAASAPRPGESTWAIDPID